MNNTASASSANAADWAAFRRRFYTVAAILAALLVLLWLLGYGPGGSACKAGAAMTTAAPAAPTPTPSPAPSPEPTASPAPVAAATPAAAGSMPHTIVYFEVGKADLPADADKALADVVAALKTSAASKVQLSGFHDPSGNLAQNEELAHNRARAVRAALEAAGIARDRVVMAKPAVTTGSGDARAARRVEVTVL